MTVGFTSATSVIIAVSQLKGLLGLNFNSDGSFFTVLKNVAQHIHETKSPDVCLGVICIIILLVLRVRIFSFVVIVSLGSVCRIELFSYSTLLHVAM